MSYSSGGLGTPPFEALSSLEPYNYIGSARRFLASTFLLDRGSIGRVLFHGLILSFIIAGFWLLDSLKDPVLTTINGIEYQPMAKLGSVVVTLMTTFVYEYMTTKLRKLELFHFVSSVFGFVFLVISALLSDPSYGLKIEPKGPQNAVGWLSYFLIEAYGSLMVALFWSYTNSIMNLEEAKGAYGLIISVAQIGAILGSTMATQASKFGIPVLFLLGSMTIFCISLLMKVYVIVLPRKKRRDPKKEYLSNINMDTTMEGPAVERKRGGLAEGLSLVVRHKYTLFILGVSCVYEVVVTILDYQFKVMGAASVQNSANGDNENDFALLLGHFGQMTNIFSFFVSLFGFSFLVNRLGVRSSLMIFPVLLFTGVIITNLLSSLWVLFVVVSLIKALIFSFHDPVKELLYIPTSETIKFKAKAWIDVFGARSAKALGSFICYSAFGDAATLRTVGEIPCIVASVAVITLAYLAGSEFQRLVDSGIVISAEGESEAVVDANVEPIGVGDEGAAMLMESISSGSGEGGGGRGEIEDDFLGTIRLRSLSKSYDVDDPR
jgi:AAA family ATP:ADP antiporter